MDRALGGKVASPGATTSATTSEASSSKQEEDAALASGKTDLLLRFFDSSFFTEYIAVTYVPHPASHPLTGDPLQPRVAAESHPMRADDVTDSHPVCVGRSA